LSHQARRLQALRVNNCIQPSHVYSPPNPPCGEETRGMRATSRAPSPAPRSRSARDPPARWRTKTWAPRSAGSSPSRSGAKFTRFVSKLCETIFFISEAQGLKPGAFKLWVTTEFNLYTSPPSTGPGPRCATRRASATCQCVAVQVAFESKL
jgi:hypothetical protein